MQEKTSPVPKNYTSFKDFEKFIEGGFPILTYHHISRPPWGAKIRGLYVTPRILDRQLAELSKAGYTFPALSAELLHPYEKEDSPKQMALTIDDGYVNVLENAVPILKKHRATAILYVVAGMMGKTNEWDTLKGEVPARLMDTGQIAQWLAEGFQIGAHSMTHPHLTQIAPDRAREEISASRKWLEDRFQIPVTSFCYPYGDCNGQIASIVEEEGYETAVTLVPGVNQPGTNRFLLRRFSARRPMNPLKRLSRKLRGKVIK